MPVQKAVEINIKAIRKLKERVARLPHERIIEAHIKPAANRGTIEEILINNL